MVCSRVECTQSRDQVPHVCIYKRYFPSKPLAAFSKISTTYRDQGIIAEHAVSESTDASKNNQYSPSLSHEIHIWTSPSASVKEEKKKKKGTSTTLEVNNRAQNEKIS